MESKEDSAGAWRQRAVAWGPVVVVFLILLAGADYLGNWGLLRLNIQSTRLKDPGAGLPEGSNEGDFKKGFVLYAGPWEGSDVWIVEGRALKSIWTQRETGEWKASKRVLTDEEARRIDRLIGRLRRYCGYSYWNRHIADGEQLTLYETPDAGGRPVLYGSNAMIWALTELNNELYGLGRQGGATQVELDAQMLEVVKRVGRE